MRREISYIWLTCLWVCLPVMHLLIITFLGKRRANRWLKLFQLLLVACLFVLLCLFDCFLTCFYSLVAVLVVFLRSGNEHLLLKDLSSFVIVLLLSLLLLSLSIWRLFFSLSHTLSFCFSHPLSLSFSQPPLSSSLYLTPSLLACLSSP